jgi:hypothetical protein
LKDAAHDTFDETKARLHTGVADTAEEAQLRYGDAYIQAKVDQATPSAATAPSMIRWRRREAAGDQLAPEPSTGRPPAHPFWIMTVVAVAGGPAIIALSAASEQTPSVPSGRNLEAVDIGPPDPRRGEGRPVGRRLAKHP